MSVRIPANTSDDLPAKAAKVGSTAFWFDAFHDSEDGADGWLTFEDVDDEDLVLDALGVDRKARDARLVDEAQRTVDRLEAVIAQEVFDIGHVDEKAAELAEPIAERTAVLQEVEDAYHALPEGASKREKKEAEKRLRKAARSVKQTGLEAALAERAANAHRALATERINNAQRELDDARAVLERTG